MIPVYIYDNNRLVFLFITRTLAQVFPCLGAAIVCRRGRRAQYTRAERSIDDRKKITRARTHDIHTHTSSRVNIIVVCTSRPHNVIIIIINYIILYSLTCV